MNIVKFYFPLIVFLITNVNANENICVNLKKEISSAVVSVGFYVSDTIDLDKVFSIIMKRESKVFNSNVNIDNGSYILPFYATKNQTISLSSDNGAFYFFKSPELTITGGGDKYNKDNNSEDSSNKKDDYPQDMLKYDGYKEAYDSITNYQLYINMFSTKFSDIDCDRHFDLGAMAYIMSNKLVSSLSKINWYHIKGNDFNMIMNYNALDSSVQIQYYLKDRVIELNYYYKQPIDVEAFKAWLSSI